MKVSTVTLVAMALLGSIILPPAAFASTAEGPECVRLPVSLEQVDSSHLAPPEPGPVPASMASHESAIDVAALEAFMDGMVLTQLREKEIAGATVAVVGGGEVLMAKGYGWADLKARRPVDPERTLFRLASVTKLFTWVALMQLVEQGEVGLHEDLNRYLDFPIPATYPEPVTAFHLLTHTPGFEEDMRNLFARSPEEMVSLGQWVQDNLPHRVRPPGTFSSYSNHGTALAGYVVEQVSGLSWEDYLEEHLLGPLEMDHTSGREPLPTSLSGSVATGYDLRRGVLEAQPFELSKGGAPAGSASSTAADMARFMLAMLGGGLLDDVRILEESTVHQMFSHQFGHDPRLPGYGLGFEEMSSHGVRILGHGGNSLWFHNILALFPDQDLGLFVSFNTSTAAPLTYGSFLITFLDRFFPDPPPMLSASEPGSLAPLTGTYRFNRMSYTTFQKVAGLAFGMSVREDEGVLVVGSPLGTMRMVQVEPLLFREELGSTLLAFRTDDEGQGTYAFLSLAPMLAGERVPWHGSPALHFTILGGGMLVFMGLLVSGLVTWIRQREGAEARRASIVLARRALLITGTAYLLFVVSVAGLAIPDVFAFLSTPMTGFALVLVFPLLGTLAALVAGVAVGIQWWRGRGTWWSRLWSSGLVLVALLFAWSLHYWNLLGWRF